MPPSVFPKGGTIYRPDKAYNCFVLHEGRDAKSYLIDMNGNDVNVFDYPVIQPRFATHLGSTTPEQFVGDSSTPRATSSPSLLF